MSIKKMSANEKPFSKWNFICMGGCCVLILVGFLLMLGGGSSIEVGFNPDIFSTRRIVVGPLLAFIGFLLMAFAILIDPVKLYHKVRNRGKDNKQTAGSASEEENTVIPAPSDEEKTVIR